MAERMSLEGLRYVRAVGETGSFSAAARAYGVTQPALSNGIARLEEQLGARLFRRSPRGAAPTSLGAAVLPLVERALTAVDEMTAEAARWNSPAATRIRVGVSPLIDPHLVARLYSAVTAMDGARHLVLSEANMAELRGGLTAGDLDLVIIPSVAPMPRYEHRVIDAEPIALIEARPERAGVASVEELAGKRWILMPDTCGLTTFTRDLLTEWALPMDAYPGEASSYRVLEEWSNLGLGSAMLPVSKLADPATVYRTVVDGEGNGVEIFYEAVWNPRSAGAAALRELADRIAVPVA